MTFVFWEEQEMVGWEKRWVYADFGRGVVVMALTPTAARIWQVQRPCPASAPEANQLPGIHATDAKQILLFCPRAGNNVRLCERRTTL